MGGERTVVVDVQLRVRVSSLGYVTEESSVHRLDCYSARTRTSLEGNVYELLSQETVEDGVTESAVLLKDLAVKDRKVSMIHATKM